MASAGSININVHITSSVGVGRPNLALNPHIKVSRYVGDPHTTSASSYGYGLPVNRWVTVISEFSLSTPAKIEDFIVRLRSGLLGRNNQQIEAVRKFVDGSYDTLVSGYNLDNPEEVEEYLVKLRAQLLTGDREKLYGESDEYRERYGYRISGRHDYRYDYTTCCCPTDHICCWHACFDFQYGGECHHDVPEQTYANVSWDGKLRHCPVRSHTPLPDFSHTHKKD